MVLIAILNVPLVLLMAPNDILNPYSFYEFKVRYFYCYNVAYGIIDIIGLIICGTVEVS